MAESSAPVRGETITDVGPAPGDGYPDASRPVSADRPVPADRLLPADRAVTAQWEPVGRAVPAGDGSSDQLARLEDKTARIEEKLARSEAATQRVVDRFEVASTRMNEVALQSDLAAVRGEVTASLRRVRALPGFPALIATSVVTALLTAVIFIVILKYMPALLAR